MFVIMFVSLFIYLSIHPSTRHVSNILWACATLGHQPSSALFDALSTRIMNTCSDFESQAVTNILWALASLKLQPSPHLAEALIGQATRVLPMCSAQSVANIVWALGTFSLQPPGALEKAMRVRFAVTAADMTAQGIAIFARGHAALGILPSHHAFQLLVARCVSLSTQMRAHEIARTLWSVVSVANASTPNNAQRSQDPDNNDTLQWATQHQGTVQMVESLSSAGSSSSSTSSASVFDAQSVSMVFRAIASFSRLPPPSPPPSTAPPRAELSSHGRGAGMSQVQDAQEQDAQHQATSSLPSRAYMHLPAQRCSSKNARGAGWLRKSQSAGTATLLYQLLPRLQTCAPEFSPQDLATTYWCLATLGVGVCLCVWL